MSVFEDGNTVYRSGVVAIAGRPNVGKSTLVNALMGWKYSIVSSKPQTTRHCTRYVFSGKEGQVVLMDTPGLHRPLHLLGRTMEKNLLKALSQVDMVCLVTEATDKSVGPADRILVDRIACGASVPVFLVVNKTDLVSDPAEAAERIRGFYEGSLEICDEALVSAEKNAGVDGLARRLVERMPPGPPLYPEDMAGDFSERFLAAEIIREKILEQTEQEVPHSVAVVVEEFKSPDEYPERNTLFVRAEIYVERPGQKGILIGKGGSKLKAVATAARVDIEHQFGWKVYLDLWIKVRPRWRENESDLRRMGLL
ncbi:MAG: GTPase Era [Thermovirgaceae bacterium]